MLYLIEYGANIEAVTSDGETPLLAACWDEHWDLVSVLVDEGAALNVVDKHGYIPLSPREPGDGEDVDCRRC